MRCRFQYPCRASIVPLAAVVAACSSTQTSLNAPTADKCQVSVSNAPSAFAATGGQGSIDHHDRARLHLVDRDRRELGVDRRGALAGRARPRFPTPWRRIRRRRRAPPPSSSASPERVREPGGGACVSSR